MTLSNEELARVARVADPSEGWVLVDDGMGPYIGTRSGTGVWRPDFGGELDNRHQALAIVEWLVGKLMNEPILDPVGTRRGKLMRAIADKDTTALMRMVIELGEL